MFKSLKNNLKKAVSVSVALLLCFGAFAAIPKISVKAETAALYKDEFVSESGVFNTEAEGFPSNYIFDLSGLKKSWAASISGFYAKVPKKLFQAIRNGGKTVTLVDALGTHHIYRPEDISPKIDTLSSATFNVGTLYRKSKSYADTGNKIAAESGIDINPDTFKAWGNFIFLQAVSGAKAVTGCEIRFKPDCKNDMPGITDGSDGCDAEHFLCCAENESLFIYEYASGKLTERTTQTAYKCSDTQIGFTRSDSVLKGDTGNKQYMISDRKLKKSDIVSAAAWQDDFLENGKFNTAAKDFPREMIFDFSAQPNLSGYCKAVPKEFFEAVRASGKKAVIVDGLGIRYTFAAENISEIPKERFNDTVPVGARYRNGASYVKIAKKIAADNMGINGESFNIYDNFGFLELQTGNGIADNCSVSIKMDFGNGDTKAASLFYSYALRKSLYIYQYRSQTLTDRETEMAGALENPYITFSKKESGSIQLLLSDRPLRSVSEEPAKTALYREDFVKNGKFVTEAPGFPSEYTFIFSSFSASTPGFSRELYSAIKHSGKTVTLIDRFGIEYIFNSTDMGELSSGDVDGIFQLQSLYKTSKSYQSVMSKIAGLSQIYDGFYINQDWVVLDIQPETNVKTEVNNSFPCNAKIKFRLTGGQSGEAGDATAARFAEYAREGKLKAYYYNKSNDAQDIYTDREPIIPTVDDEGNIMIAVSSPATLIFTAKDLLYGRNNPVDHNPYEMVIRKDGKIISDGYTVEAGNHIFLDLFMNNGRIFKHSYTWEVIGPGKDSVKINEAEDARNVCYELYALSEGKPFQIRVTADGDPTNFVTTGLITVTNSLYGKEFLNDGEFVTDAEGFPNDYVFRMPSNKYLISGEFLNAAYLSGKDVSIVDSTGITYHLDQKNLKKINSSEWNDTYAFKALYKDSDAYKKAMQLIAYRNDHTSYQINTDYQIIDFQAHGQDFPFEITATFRLNSKTQNEDLAEYYEQLMRQGNLYVYKYDKKRQNVTDTVKGLTLNEKGEFSLSITSPVTVVFSTKILLESSNEYFEAEEELTRTGDYEKPQLFAMLFAVSLIVVIAVGQKKEKTV